MNPPTTPSDAKTEQRRGRGMNTAPGSTQALQRLAGALKTRLDLDTYRAILANLTWPFVVQAVIVTRSYTAGFDAALRLLEFADAHRDQLAPREIDAHHKALYWFLLDMLDRLDEWDGYLDAWQQIRTHTDLALTYDAATPQAERMAPYILRRDRHTLRVHFLWPAAPRKAVVERKVEARRKGWRLGNRRHRPQDELSPAELQRRLDRIASLARAASWRPSASPEPPPEPGAGPSWTPTAGGISITLSVDLEEAMRAWAAAHEVDIEDVEL